MKIFIIKSIRKKNVGIVKITENHFILLFVLVFQLFVIQINAMKPVKKLKKVRGMKYFRLNPKL
jgi:hypothetical protein